MSKITLELDLDVSTDRQLLEIITRFKASIAQGEQVSIRGIAAMTEGIQIMPDAKELAKTMKEASTIANKLGKQVGNTKMSNKERAKVAAKARWDKEKKKKGKKEKNKEKKRNEVDTKVDTKNDDNVIIDPVPEMMDINELLGCAVPMRDGSIGPIVIDGRQILDGEYINEEGFTYDQVIPQTMTREELEEIYVREARERARKHMEGIKLPPV